MDEVQRAQKALLVLGKLALLVQKETKVLLKRSNKYTVYMLISIDLGGRGTKGSEGPPGIGEIGPRGPKGDKGSFENVK